MSEHPWITTLTHGKFYPLEPERSDFRIADIAHALARTCRFSGQGRFYSVAQHSVLVSAMVSRKNAPWGLLHDAAEAYLSDVCGPIKHTPLLTGYRELEERTMDAICRHFGLAIFEPEEVRDADHAILKSEARAIGLFTSEWEASDLPDAHLQIAPWGPERAERAFLRAFYRLWGVKYPARETVGLITPDTDASETEGPSQTTSQGTEGGKGPFRANGEGGGFS